MMFGSLESSSERKSELSLSADELKLLDEELVYHDGPICGYARRTSTAALHAVVVELLPGAVFAWGGPGLKPRSSQGGTVFVGAYWSRRKESKQSSAERISACLSALAALPAYSQWFTLGTSRRAARRVRVQIDSVGIATHLVSSRRDTDRAPIEELGFNLAIWNGHQSNLLVHIGSDSEHVGNFAVLQLGDLGDEPPRAYRELLEQMIRSFDPTHAVVTSNELLARHRASRPWECGWFTYQKGGTVVEHTKP